MNTHSEYVYVVGHLLGCVGLPVTSNESSIPSSPHPDVYMHPMASASCQVVLQCGHQPSCKYLLWSLYSVDFT